MSEESEPIPPRWFALCLFCLWVFLGTIAQLIDLARPKH